VRDRGRADIESPPVPGARVLFGAAFALMALDFADRQVVVAAFPYLAHDWQLSDTQLGALVSIVSVMVAVASFPVALLADRYSRTRAIAIMGTAWSLATAAAGAAQNYGQLIAARGVVGIGQAGYGPAAGAMLATRFPARHRASVLGAFQAAGPLGAVLGVALGGVIAAGWGWRAAFWVFALPGLVLSVLFLRLRDYPTVRLGEVAGLRPTRRTLAELFRARSGIAAYVGGAVQLMVVSTLWTWLPSHFGRNYGMVPERAAGVAALVILAGSTGMIVFGRVADRAAARDPRARLWVCGAVALVTLALLTLAFAAVVPGLVQLLLIIVGGATMTGAVGPVAAVVVDVVHPALRATAISTMAVVQNLFGLAVGPVLAGLLSDQYGIAATLAAMPLLCGVAAGVFLWGSRSYAGDRDAVLGAASSSRGAGGAG
jgi:MFS family permease